MKLIDNYNIKVWNKKEEYIVNYYLYFSKNNEKVRIFGFNTKKKLNNTSWTKICNYLLNNNNLIDYVEDDDKKGRIKINEFYYMKLKNNNKRNFRQTKLI